ERTLSSGGRTRRFRLVVPPGALPGPAPLVLNIHGLVENPKVHEWYTAMDEAAAARGMVVVYPQGLGNSWNAGPACCGRARDEGVDDVRFFRDLVREVESEVCIDRARVFATGMSNGGIMSYRLACDASDLVAAIAPVAGVEAAAACAPKRPVPVLAFNGTSDFLVTWKGGWFGLEAPQASIARWSERDRCAGPPSQSIYAKGDARCDAAPGCAADVVLCRIDGGGHTWPGALEAFFLGKTSSDIDATATILDFFLDHPLTWTADAPAVAAASR
ncbi:MAG TPA: PHB depolymerase family esterase, partial [Myxococcales bacterium]|nr:PHB depolymerase family esterase [Myxococcales bacterium]